MRDPHTDGNGHSNPHTDAPDTNARHHSSSQRDTFAYITSDGFTYEQSCRRSYGDTNTGTDADAA